MTPQSLMLQEVGTHLGWPVVSAAASIGALYQAPMDLRNTVTLCISQSGSSSDLIEHAQWAKRQGAKVVSLLNSLDSPLAAASDFVVALGAGAERSVAATKSHLASLSVILQFVALRSSCSVRGTQR